MDMSFYGYVVKGMFKDIKRDKLKITKVLFATLVCGYVGDAILLFVGW